MPVDDRLKAIRKIQKLTQRQVANGIGIAERHYQSFEYGTVRPSYDTLIALADFLDVSLDYLVGRSDNPTRQ